jgi:hypothetical protein
MLIKINAGHYVMANAEKAREPTLSAQKLH